ncbi:MAG: RHS repeat-associated core domain-containing protein, partial [Pyrinomonadaceae bacterium]|nr:RHS repeat-associated core domain-containing protein [Pyrinomonadaceae bacterium]
WNGSAWATVTGGSVTGNNKVWRRFNFSAISTTKIRVLTNAAPDNWSRLTEVEAWSGTSSANINWLVADQLGTPRMVIDKTGSLANVKRHDYLPFGEELVALQGVRTTGLGYIADTIRQKFTSYERDGETQLDYAQARYYSSQQGRFTSVDPLMASASTGDPQTFNRYTYALNSPANVTDPSGMLSMNATSACGNGCPNSDKNDSGGWGGAFTAGGIEKTPETQIQANIRIWNAIVRALEQAFPSQNSTASCGCTLKVRGKAGKQLSPGNPLRFPGRNQKLGPNGSSFYWGWQIEETGTVSDDVSTWTISRVWEDRSTVTYEDGTSETYTKSGFEDANRVYQPKGGHRFYSLDAPGFKKLQLLYANVRSASNVTNFTTYLHKGNIVREARWSISMTYTNGRLPLADFKPHHVQLK